MTVRPRRTRIGVRQSMWSRRASTAPVIGWSSNKLMPYSLAATFGVTAEKGRRWEAVAGSGRGGRERGML